MGGRALIEAVAIGKRRVTLRELDHIFLVAALRHQNADLARRLGRQPRLQHVALGRFRRHVNLRRWRVVRIKLLKRHLQQLRFARGPGFRIAGLQLEAIDHTSAAKEKHLHDGAFGPELHAKDIAIVETRGRQFLLSLAHRRYRANGIAQLRRFLVALSAGRRAHPLLQLARQLLVPSFEKEPRVRDRQGVALVRAHRRDAGRETAADVVFQTRPRPVASDHLVARAQPEHAMGQRHRAPRQLGGQKGPGKKISALLHLSRDEHTGIRLGDRELKVGIILIVAQEDVVPGHPLLDQVVLERERLHDRIGDNHFQPRNVVEQRVVAGAETVRAEITPDAIAQRPGFTDVERLACRVRVEVHSRLVRQSLNLLLEVVNRHRIRYGHSNAQLTRVGGSIVNCKQ